MAPVLGMDEDTGARVCHGRWQYTVENIEGLLPEGAYVKGRENRMLTDGKARVLAEENGLPTLSVHAFGKGKGIYLSAFEVNNANTRMLLNLILFAAGKDLNQNYLTDNVETECAYYPGSRQLVVINNSNCVQTTNIQTENGRMQFTLQPFETQMKEME